MEAKVVNESEITKEITRKVTRIYVERKIDIGLTWTFELSQKFIRLRKECEQRFVGKRSGSFPERGWTYILKQLGIEDKLTPAQAKKKWEMFVAKYRDEKDPTRIGKPPDTPITWPLFPLMEWALADKLAMQRRSKIYDYQITEDGEVIINTDNTSDAETLAQEQAILAENVSIVVIEDPPALTEEVVSILVPEVEEKAASTPHKRKPPTKRSSVTTPRKRARQRKSKAAVTTEIGETSELVDTHDEAIVGEASASPLHETSTTFVPTTTPLTTTQAQTTSEPTMYALPPSVHQRIAAMLDAEDSLRVAELRDIKVQLSEIVRLTKEQNETMRQQTDVAKQTAEALQAIALNAARQAAAMEKCVHIVEVKFGVKQHTVEINIEDIESQS